ncbi:replication protein [Paraburkholderia sp. DGU8]|uniref:replication protein n=1 Tax=Paraburkholderia sp. DGU8 TaxID=3161997 RepID=UPI003466721E
MALADVLHLPEHRGAQLEDGYMRVANELARAITWARLTSNQRCILDVVMWQTYGFNKSVDDISRTQFAAETGIDPSDVRIVLNQLVELNIITRGEGRYARSYSINKRHATWKLPDARKLVNKPGYQGGNPPLNGGEVPFFEGGDSPVEGGEFPPTKDNSKKHSQKTTPKEDLSRSLRERFEIFWAAYPKKKSKTTAEKAFAKRNPDEQLFNDLMAGLERATTSEQWQNPQFIPHAGTWLNAGGWMDEIQSAYTDDELAVIRAFNGALGERIGTVDEAVFVEARAGAIRAFLGKLAADPEAWKRYFPAVRDKVELPPHAGFDYLISPKGYGDVKGRMAIKRNPDGTKASGEWDRSASGIRAMAIEMGVPFTDEDPMPAVAARVRAAIAKQEGNA